MKGRTFLGLQMDLAEINFAKIYRTNTTLNDRIKLTVLELNDIKALLRLLDDVCAEDRVLINGLERDLRELREKYIPALESDVSLAATRCSFEILIDEMWMTMKLLTADYELQTPDAMQRWKASAWGEERGSRSDSDAA